MSKYSKVVYWLTLIGPVANAILACVKSIGSILGKDK